MTRHRRTRSWWPKRRTVAAPEDATTEPMARPAPAEFVVTDLGEFYRDAEVLFAGVAATRARVENQHSERAERERLLAAHRRQHGPYLALDAVVPAPPAPGGAT